MKSIYKYTITVKYWEVGGAYTETESGITIGSCYKDALRHLESFYSSDSSEILEVNIKEICHLDNMVNNEPEEIKALAEALL